MYLGVVGRTMLRPRVSLCGLFYLCILELTLFEFNSLVALRGLQMVTIGEETQTGPTEQPLSCSPERLSVCCKLSVMMILKSQSHGSPK